MNLSSDSHHGLFAIKHSDAVYIKEIRIFYNPDSLVSSFLPAALCILVGSLSCGPVNALTGRSMEEANLETAWCIHIHSSGGRKPPALPLFNRILCVTANNSLCESNERFPSEQGQKLSLYPETWHPSSQKQKKQEWGAQLFRSE